MYKCILYVLQKGHKCHKIVYCMCCSECARVATCCIMLLTCLFHESSLGRIAALLRRPCLSRPHLEAANWWPGGPTASRAVIRMRENNKQRVNKQSKLYHTHKQQRTDKRFLSSDLWNNNYNVIWCVHMHIYIYMYIYTYIHLHIHIHIHIHMHIHTHMHVHIYIYTCVYTHVYIVCVCVCMYMYIYIYIYMLWYNIHVYIQVYTYEEDPEVELLGGSEMMSVRHRLDGYLARQNDDLALQSQRRDEHPQSCMVTLFALPPGWY